MALHSLDILFRPTHAWRAIAADAESAAKTLLTHTAPWAIVPAASWYYGVTQVGWRVGDAALQRIAPSSATTICALLYVAMIAGVSIVGYLVHWMAATYGAVQSSFARGVTLVSFTATPFFLAGLLGLHPSLWIDLGVGVLVACHCIFLLYTGVPIVMRVAPERGFLFASAVVAIALVGVVASMGGTAILWDVGAEPVYTD